MSGELVEKLLSELGTFGKWHGLNLIVLSVSISVLESVNIFLTSFMGYAPSHHCKPAANLTVDQSVPPSNLASQQWMQCVEYANKSYPDPKNVISCQNGWEYQERIVTIVTEWDLVCDRSNLEATNHLVFTLSRMLGNMFAVWLIDRKGRRKPLLFGLLCYVVIFPIYAWLPNIYVLWAFTALRGFASQILFAPALVLLSELYTSKQRVRNGFVNRISRSLAVFSTILIYYLTQNWRYLATTLTAFGSVGIIALFYLPESPSWLLQNGKIEETIKIFRQAANRNKKTIPDKHFESLLYSTTQNTDLNYKFKDNAKKETLKDLFKNVRLRKTFIAIVIIWCLDVLVGYGSMLYLRQLSGGLFLNYTFLAIADYPAAAVTIFIVPRIGRKLTLAGAHVFLVIMFCLLAISSSMTTIDLSIMTSICTVLARVGVSCCWSIHFFNTSEMFPTTVRSSVIGFCFIIAQTPSTFIAYILNNREDYPYLPGTLFAISAFIAVIMVSFLPETKDKPIMQTIQEFEIRTAVSSKAKNVVSPFVNSQTKPTENALAG